MEEKVKVKPEVIKIEAQVLPEAKLPANVKEEPPVITSEKMITLYDEILNNIRDDRKEATEAYDLMKNNIVNEGDATDSSKEAMVNLLKLRHETSDKMTKVMDLLMRAILKDKNTFPPYLAHQEKTVIINNPKKDTRNIINRLIEDTKGKNEQNKS